MSSWFSYPLLDRIAMLQASADVKNLPDYAIEKDWWMTKALQALFQTEIGPFCRFKGGSSLSKGWGLINRLSEDVDIALSHRFFNKSIENSNQLKNLRKACRKYLIEEYPILLSEALQRLGAVDFEVEPETALQCIAISSDADPTVINVKYQSIAEHQSDYMLPVVKVEISCLSLEEPSVTKTLSSIVNEVYPEVDDESLCDIPTVHPSRTFLEKAFLLCEEFQKDVPRSLRMSRHLYDLVCMMDTSFGVEALKDMELYRTIVEHRRKFYHLGYANYYKDYPQYISFLPPESCSSEYEQDYDALLSSFVYGQAPTYKELIAHLKELETRFHNIK